MKRLNKAMFSDKPAKQADKPIREPARKPAKKISLTSIMFYLLLATIMVTATSLAKYTTTTPTGSMDISRVAGFDVRVDEIKDDGTGNLTQPWDAYNDLDDLTVYPFSDTQTYQFTVTNNSEVAVRARLVVSSDHYLDDQSSSEHRDIKASGDWDIVWDTLTHVSGDPLNLSEGASDWIYFAPGGQSDVFTVEVESHPDGHKATMDIEYEQVD